LYPQKRKPTLRVYGWDKPFITLGYSQKPQNVLKTDRFPFVRRMTGGAAILHASEITYSLALSCDDLDLHQGVKESYRQLAGFLFNFYARFGLKAEFAIDVLQDKTNLGHYGEFCFNSFEDFDILINNKKVGGNSQKRRKEFIFQHGSIPLALDYDLIRQTLKETDDELEKKTQGLSGLLKEPANAELLKQQLWYAFGETFGVECALSDLDRDEHDLANQLLTEKYKTDIWNWGSNEKTVLA
jgi:lipoyl(octanoyl) transferase